MSDTEVVETPQKPKKMTATELRELKNLTKKDFNLLRSELNRRANLMDNAINAELERLKDEAEAEVVKAFSSIQKRVDALNESIGKIVDDLNEKGFVTSWGGGTDELKKSDFRVRWDPTKKGVYKTEPTELREAQRQIHNDAHKARINFDREEYEVTRKIVEDFIDSRTALDHINALPKVEDFLDVPEAIEASFTAALEA